MSTCKPTGSEQQSNLMEMSQQGKSVGTKEIQRQLKMGNEVLGMGKEKWEDAI